MLQGKRRQGSRKVKWSRPTANSRGPRLSVMRTHIHWRSVLANSHSSGRIFSYPQRHQRRCQMMCGIVRLLHGFPKHARRLVVEGPRDSQGESSSLQGLWERLAQSWRRRGRVGPNLVRWIARSHRGVSGAHAPRLVAAAHVRGLGPYSGRRAEAVCLARRRTASVTSAAFAPVAHLSVNSAHGVVGASVRVLVAEG